MKRLAAVRLLPIVVALAAALGAPSTGSAATVVNGDFESGSLQGWQVHRATEAGNWFAYSGTSDPIADRRGGQPIQPPPQGAYAAIADEINPESLILSQEVTLAAGLEHRLSLLAFYDSFKPIAVPAPDTLAVDDETLAGRANQQFRIDIMRPGAAIDSVDPADLLHTVFRTQFGDPQTLPPTRLTTDLTPFAGQTVRLRIAVAAHEEVLAAGVDAISIASAPPSQLKPETKGGGGKGGGNGSKDGNPTRLGFGKLELNTKNGTAVLPVRIPGPGRLSAKAKKRIKPTSAQRAAADTVRLHLKPTAAALAILRHKHKLRVQLAVTFAPKSGAREATKIPVTLKLAPPKAARR